MSSLKPKLEATSSVTSFHSTKNFERTSEGVVDATPYVFLKFLQDDSSSAPAFFSSCVHIPYTRFDTSLVRIYYSSIVTRYDVISSRWSSHFEEKCVFCTLFRWKKAQNANKKQCLMVSYYTCTNIFNFRRFWKFLFSVKSRWLSFLMTSKAVSSAHNIYLILKARYSLFTKGKMSLRFCDTAKPKGGFWELHQPLSQLIPRWGCGFNVLDCTSRGSI